MGWCCIQDVVNLEDRHLRQHEDAHHEVTPSHLPRIILPSSTSPLPAKTKVRLKILPTGQFLSKLLTILG